MYSEALLAVTGWLLMVSTGAAVTDGVEMNFVLPPMTIADADGANEISVPLTVIARPPGMRVWLPIMYSEALLAVTGWLLMVSGATVTDGVEMKFVLPPMTIAEADGANEISVPLTVMAGPPGMRVWLPIMYSEALLAVTG